MADEMTLKPVSRTARRISDKSDSGHLAILQMGVAIWNRWRVKDPLIAPSLKNADLSGLDLENINLCGADLRGADLSGCYLYDADFQNADLRWANLCRAGLIGANFHRANLSGANLKHAYLAQSDLSNADFSSACLQEADLQAALLTQAIFTSTNLAKAELNDCFDLTVAQLEVAEDARLAFCADSLKAMLSLPGKDSTSESALGLCGSDQPTFSKAKGPEAIGPEAIGPEAIGPEAIGSEAKKSQRIKAFRPSIEPFPSDTRLMKEPVVSQPATLQKWASV